MRTMTIEQAIEYVEKVAAEQEYFMGQFDAASGYARSGNEAIRTESAKECEKCAAEHRQIAAWLRELQRARVLLKATHDLLEAADDSPYVEDVLGILVHYDDTDCDGSCLMEDIEYYFDEFGEERRTDG